MTFVAVSFRGGLSMLKTPFLGPVIATMLLAGATVSLAAPASGRGAAARAQVNMSVADFNAWDGHLDSAGVTSVGEGDLASAVASPAWAPQPDRYGADAAPATGDFAGASKLANINPEADALPLSQFAGAHAKPTPTHGAVDVWDIVDRVRYGHLPEPASWALMLIGFGMIGAALRGFVVANRRLARLQPEDGE
jgi:hypothetical protein